MDSLSRLDTTSSEKGSRAARRSSSEFRRSRWRLDGFDLAPSAGVGFTLDIKTEDIAIDSNKNKGYFQQLQNRID